jgi:hypothetical protein
MQGDQTIGKKLTQTLGKVAQTKKRQKLNFKVQNIAIKPSKQNTSTNHIHKDLPWPLRSSPNGEFSPNLVTMLACSHAVFSETIRSMALAVSYSILSSIMCTFLKV